jgi:hypothetical protein
MTTCKKIGLFVSLLGLLIVVFAISLIFLVMRDLNINLLFGTLIFTGVTLIWLGIPISFIFKSKTLLMQIFRILGVVGLLLAFFVSPLMFAGFDVKDTYAGATVILGVILCLVGFTGSNCQNEIIKKSSLVFKTDRIIKIIQIKSAYVNQLKHKCYICKKPFSQLKNAYHIEDCIVDRYFCEDCSKEWIWIEHYKNMMNNYLFESGDPAKEVFDIPLVSTTYGKFHNVGELIFTSKGVCFINTGCYEHYDKHSEPILGILFLPNFFCSVLIGVAIIHVFRLSYKTMSMPIVAVIFMSLLQIENSVWQKKIQKTKDRAFAEKENILKSCKDFPSKILSARDVYIFKTEEISKISGNENELKIEIKGGSKPSVFRIESGGFENYKSEIDTYLRSISLLSPEDKRELKAKIDYCDSRQSIVSKERKEEVDFQGATLQLTNCPNCLTVGILPMSDGRCPNCKKML